MELPEIGKRGGGRRKHQDDKCNITAMEQSALNRVVLQLIHSIHCTKEQEYKNFGVYEIDIMNLLSPSM